MRSINGPQRNQKHATTKETDSKVVATVHFSELVGLQRKIVQHIYSTCRLNGAKVTYPLSVQSIAESVSSSTGTTKNGLNRLCDKGVIARDSFKNGRGGWTIYRLVDCCP